MWVRCLVTLLLCWGSCTVGAVRVHDHEQVNRLDAKIGGAGDLSSGEESLLASVSKIMAGLSEDDAKAELDLIKQADDECLDAIDTLNSTLKEEFDAFLQKLGFNETQLGEKETKLYELRICMFIKSHKKVKALLERPGTKAKFELNEFTFLTSKEFKSFAGFVPNQEDLNNITRSSKGGNSAVELQLNSKTATSSVPNVNWVGTAVSSVVQNQGQCGGCWAFSASETISAMNVINGEQYPYVLSPQQLISCDTENGNQGCNGGNFQNVWGGSQPYTQSTPLQLLSVYGYSDGTTGVTSPCNTGLESGGVVKAWSNKQVLGGGFIPTYPTDDEVQQAIAKNPASIAVVASGACFQFYRGGVLTLEDCTASMGQGSKQCPLDHAIMLVGYQNWDTDNAYWIVKNSWGNSWGAGGYAYIQAQVDTSAYPCVGILGINMQVAYPQQTSQVGPPPPTPSTTPAPFPPLPDGISGPTTAPSAANCKIAASMVTMLLFFVLV